LNTGNDWNLQLTKCIAITRDGRGDLWAFGSYAEADQHPIIQYGDPIIEGQSALIKKVPIGRIPSLMLRLGATDLSERANRLLIDTNNLPHNMRVSRFNEMSQFFWAHMVSCAKKVPDDPTTILTLIRRDRKLSIEESNMTDETIPPTATEAPVKAAKAQKEPKAPKEPKAATEPKAPKYPLNAKIKLLADKEGKSYGKENNPKRPGSSSYDRFAHYVDGMTVEQALTGVKTADIDWDIQKGFIAIEA